MTANVLPLDALLPLRAVNITLRFLAPAHLHPLHQPALTAFLRTLLGEPDHYDTLLTVDTAESGRVNYRSGDRYRFTLIALSGAESLLQQALEQLSALPASAPLQDREMPFRNNIALVGMQDFLAGSRFVQSLN
ncbi:MAG: hypothetical protein R3F53_14365 [Gammaproteobacteria bacterium]